MLLILGTQAYAQRVSFISSNLIKEKFPEAQRAEQRIQSNVEQWKRELDNFDVKINNIEVDIKKNRLIWTEQELKDQQTRLKMIEKEKSEFARDVFETGGKYDQLVRNIWKPIEEKIFAAVSTVAAEQGFDFVFDKSKQPVPYTNYKYDLTLKVLKKLGVDVKALEADLNEKINADPRNQVKESEAIKKRRSRGRRGRGRRDVTPESNRLEQRSQPDEEEEEENSEESVEEEEEEKK